MKKPIPKTVWLLAVGIAVTLTAWACTRADLFGIKDEPSLPDKITLSGTVCSDNPLERRFPVKVVFLVDSSTFGVAAVGPGVMLPTARFQALQDIFARFRDASEMSFAVVNYDGDTASQTSDAFTRDRMVLSQAAQNAASQCSNPNLCNSRRFELALERANNIITGDLLTSDMGTRSRTRYVIVLYAEGPRVGDQGVPPSDGGPGTDAGQHPPNTYYCDTACLPPDGGFNRCAPYIPSCDDACSFERVIHGMRKFVVDNGGSDLIVHTTHFLATAAPQDDGGMACCGTGGDMDQCDAQTVLARMAAAGGGTYLQFFNPGQINFRALEYAASNNVFIMKSIVAVNINAKPSTGGLLVDSDGDGLSDDDEVARSLNPLNPDTDGDQLGDYLETVLANLDVDPKRMDAPLTCSTLQRNATGKYLDRDGDGLNDCEETLLGTDPTLFDTDADGFPDMVEFLYGTNYLINDVNNDTDQDGARNGEELRQHSDPRSNDAKTRGDLAYLYRIIVRDDGRGNGLSRMLDISQPRAISGVVIKSVSPRVYPGVAFLKYSAGPKTLEFQDNDNSNQYGPAVTVDQRGDYVLHAKNSVPGDPLQERSIVINSTPELLPPNNVPETLTVHETERQCVDWRIRNITLVHTAPSDQLTQFAAGALPANTKEGLNRILIYYGQAPIKNPLSPGLFRVAQVPMVFIPPRYKSPDVAELPVVDSDFVLVGETAAGP